MLNKLTITLATGLMFGAASGATAQEFDPNPGNRYPAFSGPLVGYDGTGMPPAFRADRVAPSRNRDVSLPFSTRAPRTMRAVRDEAPTASGGY
jgi:hypothetical protein